MVWRVHGFSGENSSRIRECLCSEGVTHAALISCHPVVRRGNVRERLRHFGHGVPGSLF